MTIVFGNRWTSHMIFMMKQRNFVSSLAEAQGIVLPILQQLKDIIHFECSILRRNNASIVYILKIT